MGKRKIKNIKKISRVNLPIANPIFAFFATISFIVSMGIHMNQIIYNLIITAFVIWFLVYLMELWISKGIDIFKYVKKYSTYETPAYSVEFGTKSGLAEAIEKAKERLIKNFKDVLFKKKKVIITEIGSGKYDINFEGKFQIYGASLIAVDYFKTVFTKDKYEVIEVPIPVAKYNENVSKP